MDRIKDFIGKSKDISIDRSNDLSLGCSYLCIFVYIRLPHRPFFISCDILGMA